LLPFLLLFFAFYSGVEGSCTAIIAHDDWPSSKWGPLSDLSTCLFVPAGPTLLIQNNGGLTLT
jgi:hypothetical protein